MLAAGILGIIIGLLTLPLGTPVLILGMYYLSIGITELDRKPSSDDPQDKVK